MRRISCIVCLLLLVLCAGTAFGQSDRATINGTVQDPTGAVLPDVQVQVTNTGTNLTQTVTTSNGGFYTIKNLPVGSYVVTFSKTGFRKLNRSGITLLVGQTVAIDATLQVGAQAETIEVTAAAPVLQTETPNLTTNLNNKAVTELPLNVAGGRSLSSFMFAYVPGVEGNDYSSHINGSLALSKEVMIDGTSAVAQLGGYISESQPPLEGVQEFQVETAGISAEAGRTGGGIVRYEMKSGTNQLHGSAFGFMHADGLNALSANQKLQAIKDPANSAVYLRKKETLSDWGVSGGGPIIKDKLFYYGAFERYMQSNWNIGAPGGTVPTDAMMGMNPDGSYAQYADLSNMLNRNVVLGTDSQGNPIYQGAVFIPGQNTVFVNNQIPTAMFSPVTKKILDIYHKYYTPQVAGSAVNNAMPSALPWNHINETSIKLDYNISDKHRLNGSFIYNFYPRILADQGGVWSPTAQYGGPLANAYQHNTKSPSFRVADSYNFSPNVINSFRFTLNRFYNPSSAKSAAGKWDEYLGLGHGAGNFPIIEFDAGMYGSGTVPLNGWNMSKLGSQFNDFYAANTFIYNDDVNWVKGKHIFNFGAEFRAMQFNNHVDQDVYDIVFDPVQTAAPQFWLYWDQVGSSYASFLLGDALRGSKSTPNWIYGRRKALSLYASDNIKLRPNLTLNVSLRWDYNSPYKEKNGHWSSFDINKLNPVTGLMGTYEYLKSGDESFQTRQIWYNFAPHIGVAYAVTPKTVIRGTYSIFYVPLNMNTWGGIPYQSVGNPGYHDVNAVGAFNWDNGYPGVGSVSQTPDFTQWGAVYIDPRGLMPGNTQQWTLGVQREITKDLKVDVSWVQSKSYHLQSGILLTNQPTVENMQRALPNPYDPANWPSSYNGYYNGCIWGGTCPNYVATLPYPQAGVGYGPLFSVGSPLGNSDYRGLQFNVTQRTSHGVTLQGSYVYSKAHGDVDSSMQELWWTGALQNVYDLKNEAKNIASFDVTHVVKGYVLYDLPMGKGKMLFGNVGTVGNNLIGGWSLNFGFHYNTGTPMQLHSSNNYPGFNSVYVNLVPGCDMTIGSPKVGQQYLNTACFQNPANGQLGTAGNFLEGLRNPGLATEDLGLHKAVSFGPSEQYKLSFRLEFFNVFNRHQDGSPVTSMTDPDYGKVRNYGGLGGRVGQFGARFTF